MLIETRLNYITFRLGGKKERRARKKYILLQKTLLYVVRIPRLNIFPEISPATYPFLG